MEIAGKVAVVSGGGSGIGRAAVLALVNRRGKIVVADVDEDAGRQTVGLAAEKAGTAVFCRCDVTKTEDLARAFASAVEHFGALHIAFNNAGIGGEDLFADDPGDWARVIDVDLTAVIDATRIAVLEMKRSGHGGVIINTASPIGLGPMAGAPVYAAAKAVRSTSRGRWPTSQRNRIFALTQSAPSSSTRGWHSASAKSAWRSCAKRAESSCPRT